MHIPSGSRLVIAYNAHSSRANSLKELLFDKLDAAHYKYERLEILQASLEENVAHLKDAFRPGDIILCAAGDGSAHALVHGLLAAGQPNVQVGFLAYGNFNDLARTFNTKPTLRDPVAFLHEAEVESLYPLRVVADGVELRRALLYVTIGWTARAAQCFDAPTVRAKIQAGRAHLPYSLWKIGLFYLRSRKLSVLPPFVLDARLRKRLTDIMCVNGPRVARLFRTRRRYYRRPVFLYKKLNVRSLILNLPFLLRSVFLMMPGKEKIQIEMDFVSPSSLPLQCDGEVIELTNISRLQVKKSRTALSVLTTKH